MTPEEIIAKVLEGFDKGVFVRDVSRDSDSHWAVRALPYLVALSKLAELPAALAASEQRGKDAEAWDIRKWFENLKAGGLDGYSHEDGWTLMATETAEGLKAQLQASEQKLAGMVESSAALKASINENTRLDRELRASERALERVREALTKAACIESKHFPDHYVCVGCGAWYDYATKTFSHVRDCYVGAALASPGSPQEKGE